MGCLAVALEAEDIASQMVRQGVMQKLMLPLRDAIVDGGALEGADVVGGGVAHATPAAAAAALAAAAPASGATSAAATTATGASAAARVSGGVVQVESPEARVESAWRLKANDDRLLSSHVFNCNLRP
jgi:hypothetical protein